MPDSHRGLWFVVVQESQSKRLDWIPDRRQKPKTPEDKQEGLEG